MGFLGGKAVVSAGCFASGGELSRPPKRVLTEQQRGAYEANRPQGGSWAECFPHFFRGKEMGPPEAVFQKSS